MREQCANADIRKVCSRIHQRVGAACGIRQLERFSGRVLEIAARSVADLGFDSGATYEQLTARALESGLAECPLELGPHLRMQFLDQPEGAFGVPTTHGRAPPGGLTVASPPLDDTDETPKGFYLRRVDGVLWLRGYWSWAGQVWSPEDVLVFSRVP